jgi:hypothetical protein
MEKKMKSSEVVSLSDWKDALVRSKPNLTQPSDQQFARTELVRSAEMFLSRLKVASKMPQNELPNEVWFLGEYFGDYLLALKEYFKAEEEK